MLDVEKQYNATEMEITLIKIASETSTAAKQSHQEERHGHHQQHLPSTKHSFKR